MKKWLNFINKENKQKNRVNQDLYSRGIYIIQKRKYKKPKTEKKNQT